MASVSYVAFLEQADDGVGVVFPDLDGCVSWGRDGEEAVRNAQDALALHLAGMAADGAAFPAPRAIADLAPLMREQFGHADVPAICALISAGAPDQSVQATFQTSKLLMDRADRYAEAHGLSRSAVLNLALSRLLRGDAPRESSPASGPRKPFSPNVGDEVKAPGFQREAWRGMKGR